MKSPSIRSLFLPGAAGRLEALFNAGTADAAYAGLVAHPHPLFGGTMHNKVVYHAMKALNGFGFPVLRFNFRGVGGSQGGHDDGRGEIDDVQVALEWLSKEFGKPIMFTGFSFGAAVGLRAACADSRVAALISLGTPVAAEGRAYSYEFLRECSKPKLFVSGESDQFAPSQALGRWSACCPTHPFGVDSAGRSFLYRAFGRDARALKAWIEDMLRSDRVAV